VCFTFNANQTRSSAAAQIARVTAAGRRQKLDFFDYIFVADIHSAGITLMNLTQVAPIAAGSCEITRNDGHWADQGHSRLRILVPIESPYATFFYTLSRTVSEIMRSRGQIITFDRGCLYSTPSFGVNLLNTGL